MGQKRINKEKEKWMNNKRKSGNPRSIKIVIDKLCDTPWTQAWGLMFSGRKTAFFSFKRPQRVAIHTWFMRYSLKLIFLNKKREVVEIKECMQPWSYYKPKNDVNYLIELPNDQETESIELNDRIKIIKNG